MAKTAAKSAAKESKKSPSKTSKAKASTTTSIEKVSEHTLAKLRALNIEPELQNDIEWCLGSYRADGNPVGLFQMMERALSVFKREKDNKTKGVTAKVITDLEKSIKSRE